VLRAGVPSPTGKLLVNDESAPTSPFFPCRLLHPPDSGTTNGRQKGLGNDAPGPRSSPTRVAPRAAEYFDPRPAEALCIRVVETTTLCRRPLFGPGTSVSPLPTAATTLAVIHQIEKKSRKNDISSSSRDPRSRFCRLYAVADGKHRQGRGAVTIAAGGKTESPAPSAPSQTLTDWARCLDRGLHPNYIVLHALEHAERERIGNRSPL